MSYDGFYGDLSSRATTNEALLGAQAARDGAVAAAITAEASSQAAVASAAAADTSAGLAATNASTASADASTASIKASEAAVSAADASDNSVSADASATAAALSASEAAVSASEAAASSEDAVLLRSDLLSDLGGTHVANKVESLGGVTRDLREILKDSLSVKDFGATGDGTYHPLSEVFSTLVAAQEEYPFVTSLTSSLDWAAFQAAANTGKKVYGPSGDYLLTDTVFWPNGGGFFGDGHSSWTPGSALLTSAIGGTNIIMYGTGPKVLFADHIGQDGGSDGSMPNPDAASPYTAFGPLPTYTMIDLTNGDAAGATRATLRGFSAGFVLPVGGNVTMRDFRIVPNYNGMVGYTNSGLTGLGDDWDVGIYSQSSCYNKIDNVQVVGYWRIAAVAKLATPVTNEVVQAESDSLSGCTLQGFRSLLIRTMDTYKIVSSNQAAQTVRVPWSASHRWPLSGSFRLAGTDRTYTSLTYTVVGPNKYLDFGGVSGTLGAYSSIFNIRATSSHFGTSGTVIDDCTMGGLSHHSRLMAFSNLLTPGFNKADAAVEINGNPLRAIQFTNCTIVGSAEILLYLNYCSDVQFTDTYFEGQASFTEVNSFNNQTGRSGRFISTPGTINLEFQGCTYQNTSVDKRPRVVYPLTETRFVSGVGVWNPRTYKDGSEIVGFVESNGEQTLQNLTGSLSLASGGAIRAKHGLNSSLVVGDSTSSWSKIQSNNASLRVTAPIRIIYGNTADTAWYQMDGGRFYSQIGAELGETSSPWARSYVTLRHYTASVFDSSGLGTPEGVLSASPSSTYRRRDGGALTCFYVKESGSGNTGWVAK